MIPNALGALRTLCVFMIAGCEELEDALKLQHTTSAVLSGLDDILEKAQKRVDGNLSARSKAFDEQQKQEALAYSFIQDAAKVFRKLFGNRWSQQGWPETGFPNQSTAVPGTFEERMLLTRSLKVFLTTNPQCVNEKMAVTAKRAGDLYEAMKEAATGVKDADSAYGEALGLRDKAQDDLRQAMLNLAGELELSLSSSDPRWKQFGLDIPDAPSTPAVPENVTVNADIPGKLLVTCPAVPIANYYRFFKQARTDAEPVFVGRAYEPTFVVEGLAPSVSVKVFVSAVSAAGRESALSQPVDSVPTALAA